MPEVQHTAALRGLRPVANALGAAVSLMYSRGIGWCAVLANSRTILYISGACSSLTGWACIARSAILSLLKYT